MPRKCLAPGLYAESIGEHAKPQYYVHAARNTSSKFCRRRVSRKRGDLSKAESWTPFAGLYEYIWENCGAVKKIIKIRKMEQGE